MHGQLRPGMWLLLRRLWVKKKQSLMMMLNELKKINYNEN
jgi:hypothetical protein